jgi:hypothetical protein
MQSPWKHLEDFGHLIYTVGDGTKKNTVTELNTMSIANTEKAVKLAAADPDAILFIAGGNSGEHSPRPNRVKGALTEAERMELYIREHLRSTVPVITDCHPEFHEMTGLAPSGNTPQNGRNAAAVVRLNPALHSSLDIVAERLHLPRVIGTFRKRLHDLHLLEGSHMSAHPVSVEFDPESCQEHIVSEQAFRAWEIKAKVHHILTGEVLRGEFLREWLSGHLYSHLHTKE